MSHILEVKNLKTRFKVEKGILEAINSVSYYLDPGEIVAFVGESGSGKSVTQYSSLQLIPMPPGEITGGEILFNGVDLLKYRQNSREMQQVRGGDIGVVFQEPMTSLNPIMTIGQQIQEGIALHLKLSPSEQKAHAIDLLRKVGIPDPETRLTYYPHQLSGGMRQRIMIAIALSCNPKILIADEATSALDVTTQAQILELMRDIVKETGTTLVLVTHNLSLVARYADRLYVMYAGEIMESGTTAQIFETPRHPYTTGLMHAVPSLTDRKDRKLVPIEGIVADLTRRENRCVFLNRCPFVDEICRVNPAPELKGNDAHVAKCHRQNEPGFMKSGIIDGEQRIVKAIDYTNPGEPVLSVRNLQVSFPVRNGVLQRVTGSVDIVKNVSFDVYPGETLGLVGESGCGKTTVARTVMRLNTPAAGNIIFRGTDITNLNYRQMRPLRQNISMIFQDPYGSLDPRRTVSDIIIEPLLNFGTDLNRRQLSEKADHLMELVGINPAFRQRMPHEFSGGQRQRIAIARALSTDPSFLVCDEAISALDVSIQAQIINLLVDLKDRLGIAYLFIAHDLSVVKHISDRVAVMYLGQVVEIGDWESLYERPLHPYTKVLLDAVPIPDPALEAGRSNTVIEGEVPSVLNRPEGCPFSSRCPRVMKRCRVENPELLSHDPTHSVACFAVDNNVSSHRSV